MRVVLDTNIFISALLFGGLPATLLELAFAGTFQLILSPILLDELDEKLRLKFELSQADVERIRIRLEAAADLISATPSIAFIKENPDDDRVLECAVAGRADFIVSGDRHLLKLVAYEGIDILSARQFIDKVKPVL